MKIILNILTHGNETIGLAVAKELKKNKIIHGTLLVHTANELAYKRKVRFIDEDLNRAFPGNPKGNHEQRLAYKILPRIMSADIVIDIHSTKSDLKDALIITTLNNKTRKLIEVINPKYVLLMSATKKNALISNAKVGIAFEYGKNGDKLALQKIVRDIERLLSRLKMISKTCKAGRSKTKWFDVHSTVPKTSKAKVLPSIQNYKLVKKNSVYAVAGKEKIKATEDFYPILFGSGKTYKDIFGFAGTIMKNK
jgi:succinylglutamate desuccinylase